MTRNINTLVPGTFKELRDFGPALGLRAAAVFAADDDSQHPVGGIVVQWTARILEEAVP